MHQITATGTPEVVIRQIDRQFNEQRGGTSAQEETLRSKVVGLAKEVIREQDPTTTVSMKASFDTKGDKLHTLHLDVEAT